MGVSVESAAYVERIDFLREVPATVRFLSLEPLLSSISHLDLSGIHWVIVGGESGSRPRPMKADWVLEIHEQCNRADVPFFFKQWGNIRNNPDKGDPTHKQNGGKSKGGRLLNGKIWNEMPLSAAENSVSIKSGKELS
jgi:protein gp37